MVTNMNDTASKEMAKPRAKKARGTPLPEEMGTRQAILEAALEAFSYGGFDGTSLPRIAKAANVGHPLIHYYFGSKENLWKQMVDFAFGGLLAEATTILAASRGLSPLDRLRVLIHTFALFAARHPNHLALILTESRAQGERAVWLHENYTSNFVHKMRSILADAQAAKQIREMPAYHLESIIMGSVILYFSANPALPTDGNLEDLAEEHASYVLDVVLRGIEL